MTSNVTHHNNFQISQFCFVPTKKNFFLIQKKKYFFTHISTKIFRNKKKNNFRHNIPCHHTKKFVLTKKKKIPESHRKSQTPKIFMFYILKYEAKKSLFEKSTGARGVQIQKKKNWTSAFNIPLLWMHIFKKPHIIVIIVIVCQPENEGLVEFAKVVRTMRCI